jgi:hypothetical protein
VGRGSRMTDGAIRERDEELLLDSFALRARRAVVRARVRLGARSGLTTSSINTVPILFGGTLDLSGASPYQRSYLDSIS